MKTSKILLWVSILTHGIGLYAQDITNLEYYIDNDPGYGLGTEVVVTTANTISNLQVNVSISNSLADGFHRFHIRAKDENNRWSLVAHHPFLKITLDNPPNPIPNIQRLEYYVDNDPGYGLATEIPISAGSPINGISLNVNIENSLGDGFHRVHVRAKDINGRWSVVAHHPFMKMTINNPPNLIPAVVKAEYYIDNDPGYGLAVNIPLSPGTSVSNLSAMVDLSGLSLGTHHICIRSQDSKGKWSVVGIKSINVESNAILVLNTPVSFCKNVAFIVSFGAYGTFNSGNIFTAQLMSGNTVVATLGSLMSMTSGTISAIIPNSVPLGNYEIRVISANPTPSNFPRVPIQVVNICPSPCPSNLILTSTSDDFSSGNTTKQANATNGMITATNKITGSANVSYQAKSTLLNPGFLANSGVVFKVEVGGCSE
jgi:hypothetical protein